MPLVELRIQNYRAFADTGVLDVPSLFALVGRNDAGKSAILRALGVFFDPPKRGGLPLAEIHLGNPDVSASIEVAFDPARLKTRQIRIDARNLIDIVDDGLVDDKGLLRVRLSLSTSGIEGFELRISDVDDDELFPLALRRHDDLMKFLGDRGLPAKRAGRETNQEKRAALREWAKSKGLGYRTEWVDASSIEKAVREILPEFIYFTDGSNYSIDQTAVQNQFRSVVDAALRQLPEAQAVEDEIKRLIQKEFDEIAKRFNLLFESGTKLTADPSVAWRKAVDSVGLIWEDSSGIATPYEQRGAGMRRLFMVAYFQYQAARSLYDEAGPKYVFAIEEPEVHLHPGAQRKLLSALTDVAAGGHTVIFTTHSPTFAASVPLTDICLISRAGSSSRARRYPHLNAQEIAEELGVEASDRLVGKNYVILVEGPGDAEFYSEVLKKLYEAGKTNLDPELVLFLPCGGIGTLKYWVTARCMDEAGLKWALIADSDRSAEGEPPHKSVRNVIDNLPPSCKYAHVLERSYIENYLDPDAVKAVTGIDCRIPHFGKGREVTGKPIPNSEWKKIKSNVARIVQLMSVESVINHSLDNQDKCEWIYMFENIRKGFELRDPEVASLQTS